MNLPSDFTAYKGLKFDLGTLECGQYFLGQGRGQKKSSTTRKLCIVIGINGPFSVCARVRVGVSTLLSLPVSVYLSIIERSVLTCLYSYGACQV